MRLRKTGKRRITRKTMTRIMQETCMAIINREIDADILRCLARFRRTTRKAPASPGLTRGPTPPANRRP
jgi:hypothetical protein